MSTVKVTGTILDQVSSPLPGAICNVKLNRTDVDGSYITPQEKRFIADETGHVEMDLWPNNRGVTESMYSIEVSNPVTGERVLRTNFVVYDEDGLGNPITTVDIIDVAEIPPYPGKNESQVLIEFFAAEKTVIEQYKSDAEQAATNALQYKDDAEAAATQTAADRTQTGNDVVTATEQANIATTKANTATSQAVIATNQAVISTNKAAASEASADLAAQHLAAIETIYDTFDDRYLGAFPSDPATDNDGNPLITGATYFNTTTQTTRFYNGAGWEDPEQTSTQAANTATSAAGTATTQAGIATTKAAEALASQQAAAQSESNASQHKTDAEAARDLAQGYAASVDPNSTLHTAGSGLPNEAGTAAYKDEGAGNGLDADLLDGQQGSYYRSRASHTGTQPLSTISDAGTAAYKNVSDLAQRIQKSDSSVPAVELSGSNLVASQDFKVLVGDSVVSFSAGASVTLPTLVSATDYKVYATSTGLEAVAWDSAAPANSTEIGGFHVYHTTGTINPNSIWDLKFRPPCSPRGMTRYGRLWVDIYLMDTDYGINGYSRGDATIADGSSPPKIPTAFGGDGTTTYGSLTWYEAWDLANNAGKRLPFYGEFTGFAYGVVEQQAVGTDPVTTKYQAGHRSACGVEQATGVMWQWGADIQGNVGGGWAAITDGRGSVHHSGISAVVLGANWGDGAYAGSRASFWYFAPSNSFSDIGARAACDHLILD